MQESPKEKTEGADGVSERDPSPNTLKRQKRSKQCCAYKQAYNMAINSGKDEEEAREEARAVTGPN